MPGGALGLASKISAFTGARSMASASALALFLTAVDHKPAITTLTLMEAQQGETLHYSDKPRDSH